MTLPHLSEEEREALWSSREPSQAAGDATQPLGSVALTGMYEGNAIRRARKAYDCQQMVGWAPYRECHREINPGDQYVEGDVDPYRAGGFARQRICLVCGGLAKASV